MRTHPDTLDAPLLDCAEYDLGDYSAAIGYGKAGVVIYRVGVPDQESVRRIPESSFTGRPGPLLAAELSVETTGAKFLGSWVEGDNTDLVATDTMKNFILHRSSTYSGTTAEGLAAYVGVALLQQYPAMERLRVNAQHFPFAACGVRRVGLQRLERQGVRTTLTIERTADGPTVTTVACGLDGVRFVRLHGSSFAGFPRDQYTTLADCNDRPLEVSVSVRWWYDDPLAATSDDLSRWVPAEEVEDLLGDLVDEVASQSIQQLLLVFARKMLDRFGVLSRVWFEAENRVWSLPALRPPVSGGVVLTSSLPALGVLRLGLSRRHDHGPEWA